MLKDRVKSGLLMGAALLTALALMPPVGAAILVALLGSLGLLEYFALLKSGQIPHQKWTGIAGGLALLIVPPAHYFIHGYFDPDLEFILLFVILAVVLVRQMYITPLEHSLRSIAATMLGVLYIGLLFYFIQRLLLVAGAENDRWQEGRWLFLYLCLAVKLTDIGAYFIGSKLGGRKFFPTISPAKTWSGVVGGLITGVAFSMAGLFFMQPYVAHVDLTPVHALALGFLLSASGIVGDLIESMLKRASGVKDSGSCIQGMGGFLDVVDSLIFTAPVLYIYLRLFVDIAP